MLSFENYRILSWSSQITRHEHLENQGPGVASAVAKGVDNRDETQGLICGSILRPAHTVRTLHVPSPGRGLNFDDNCALWHESSIPGHMSKLPAVVG